MGVYGPRGRKLAATGWEGAGRQIQEGGLVWATVGNAANGEQPGSDSPPGADSSLIL
jgi:hypothetical protein